MTVQEALTGLRTDLESMYGNREASLVAWLVIEHLTGLSRANYLVQRESILDKEQLDLYKVCRKQLSAARPVQYVLGEAWFAGMKLQVDERVLIPRPETEELVEWALAWLGDNRKLAHPRILDIGTGSGCIALALKKKCPKADVHALDISPAALQLAKENAASLDLNIHFHQHNILDRKRDAALGTFDVVLSNPPYIPASERVTMARHVVAYEPELALFTTDAEPLQFYQAIAAFSTKALKKEGVLFLEIHEGRGKEVCTLLEAGGFAGIVLKQDLQGKDRMIRASRVG